MTKNTLLSAAVVLLLGISCSIQEEKAPGPTGAEAYDLAAELRLLDDTFRVDIAAIDVVYDFYPDQMRAAGHAEVAFTMRPGQVRPLVHFDPGIRENAVDAITLDGEALEFGDSGDVQVRQFNGSTQQAIEFQRDLAAGIHTLQMDFHLSLPGRYPRFNSIVNDGIGRGNEERFPTINTPHELARHRLTFRVHSNRRYECVGSGIVSELPEVEPQTWTLDSVREISSYTLFFVLMPAEDVDAEERTIAGVPVRVMGYKGSVSIDAAMDLIAGFLPDFIADIGPYPAPRLSVFLVTDGGMEFYGGTISSQRALEHEVFHNWFACSVIPRTYRDSWWDEAMAMWYVDHNQGVGIEPAADAFYSDIVSGRPPIAVAFDTRAYYEGPRILQAAATAMGGSEAFVGFLRQLYRDRSFSPFNAMELADSIQAYSGVDMHARFLRWLYSYGASSSPSPATPLRSRKDVDLDPPGNGMRRDGGSEKPKKDR